MASRAASATPFLLVFTQFLDDSAPFTHPLCALLGILASQGGTHMDGAMAVVVVLLSVYLVLAIARPDLF